MYTVYQKYAFFFKEFIVVFFFDPCQSFMVETSIFLLQTKLPTLRPEGSPETSLIFAPHITEFCSHVLGNAKKNKELQYHLEMLIETQLARNFWCNIFVFSQTGQSLYENTWPKNAPRKNLERHLGLSKNI